MSRNLMLSIAMELGLTRANKTGPDEMWPPKEWKAEDWATLKDTAVCMGIEIDRDLQRACWEAYCASHVDRAGHWNPRKGTPIEATPDGMGVLVVEDDRDLRTSLVELLWEHGYEAQGAEDGRDGLRMLREGARPGLILLDLRMPFMNGWEFRAIQQREPALADIPVAIISAEASEVTQSALGAVGYLSKPVDGHALEKLKSLLVRHCAPV